MKRPKQPAPDKSNREPSEPVGKGETANPSGEIGTGTAQGAQGAPVRQWQGKQDGETEADYIRRAFEWDAAKLSEAGAASWERWKLARGVLHYGFRWAIENGAGYADILNRPEMLRAVECLINDPPEIAAAFLRPNPNPAQGDGVSRETREWFISTIQEYADNIADETGRVFSEWFTPAWGMSLARAHFEMFPICFDLACVSSRQTWAEFITVCGLPDFDEMREWLERDRKDTGRGYVQMPALYESAFSEEQYFDLQTGETNAPKYGGGGIKAGALLLRFRDYLRERQGVDGCEPLPDRGAADRKPDAAQAQGATADRDAANPSGVAGVFNLSGKVIINTPAPVQVNAPAPIAGRNVGKVSAREMAGFMGVSLSIVKKWEHPEKPYNPRPPVVDGVTYTAAIRENGAGAFVYAQRYKDTKRGALKTVGGDKGAGVAEKQAAQKWIVENAAALRETGANLSEWGL